MDDNIEQLLKNLKLSRIADVLERELQRATKTSCTYEELLARLLRHEYQCRQEQALEARIKRARLPERFCLPSTAGTASRRPRWFSAPRRRIALRWP